MTNSQIIIQINFNLQQIKLIKIIRINHVQNNNIIIIITMVIFRSKIMILNASNSFSNFEFK